MTDFIASALFVHTGETKAHLETLKAIAPDTRIIPIAFDDLMQNPKEALDGVSHVIVSGPLDVVKRVLHLGMRHEFSIGIIPTPQEKNLVRFYGIPADSSDAAALALRADARPMDLVLCNGKIVLFKAAVGRIPLLDTPRQTGWVRVCLSVIRELFGLKLSTFDFLTAGQRRISTAATGCIIVQNHRGVSASRLIGHDHSIVDGMISLVISAPLAIVDYIRLFVQSLLSTREYAELPSSVGFIKSARISIEPEVQLDVLIDDDQRTTTPLNCEAVPNAVRVNIGKDATRKSGADGKVKEIVDIDRLPSKNELLKAKRQKRVPFFSYASAERFRDLFDALRDDAAINGIFISLMVLSSLLAAAGLYLDSGSVVIGAMLLAPLMAPIVSLAMGILRKDTELFRKSMQKIVVGMGIALLSSALLTFLFPHNPVTNEMQGRLHPTLLDLAVAVLSGVAAAYSKSYREIIQSLVGVAVAVALVPPLVVAGIGIGRLDFHFFSQAFLLFSTNLIGIVFAATFTFRVLGYSAAIRSKGSVGIVLICLLLISVPLYLSYYRIVDARIFEKSWQHDRVFVNEKYLVIRKAELAWQGDRQVLLMDVFAREHLTREDLNAFRRKIEGNFGKKLIIRINTIYIP